MKNHLAFLSALLACSQLPLAGTAHAQTRGVLLEPRLRGDDVDGVGHALDRVLHTQLQSLGVLELGPTPALGLEDLQLAVGCVADTAECLDAVLTQLEVSTLVYLDVERAGSELVLTLSVFERGAPSSRTVTRRVAGDDVGARALDTIEPMAREAFGLPPLEAEPEPDPIEEGTPDASVPVAVERDPGIPIAPIVLLAAGAISLGVGLALGVVSQDTLAAYEATTVGGTGDVDVALGLYDRAESEAIAANVLFGLGGALVAAGVVVWIVEAVSAGGDEVALAPVGPGFAGVSLTGRFGGAR